MAAAAPDPPCSTDALTPLIWRVGRRAFEDWLTALVAVLLTEFCRAPVLRACGPLAAREPVVAFDLFPVIVWHIVEGSIPPAALPRGLTPEMCVGALPPRTDAPVPDGMADRLGGCFKLVFEDAARDAASAAQKAAARLMLMTLDYMRAVRRKVREKVRRPRARARARCCCLLAAR